MNVEVPVYDSPSVVGSNVSISIHADGFIGCERGMLTGSGMQDARFGRGLRVIPVDRNLVVAEQVLRRSTSI